MKLGIITYYWPPAGGPGVQRWLKLSKYLAREGVELYVVTVDAEKATYPLRDDGLLEDVAANITVCRTGTSEKFGAYKKVTGKKSVPFSGFSGEDEKVSLLQKLARFVRGNFFVPDARKGWNTHAFEAAAALVRSENIRHWITTSPPHSTQLVGLKLKKQFGVHWTADFRDPWTDIYYYRKFYPTLLTRWYERGLERKVFTTCDELISVSPSWSDLYEQKGGLEKGSVHTLTNGFDPEDFGALTPQRPAKFTLLYAGTLAAQYPCAELVAALNMLDFEMNLRIVGSWDGHSRRALEAVNDHVNVTFEEYVPKAQLNQRLLDCHLMLFLLPNVASATGHVPGKLFDYLGAGNPILGLGPVAGDAAQIITRASAGVVFDYKELEAIASYVRGMREEGAPRTDPTTVRAYARDFQAQRLLKEILRP
ncbi:MAG: glycosyltransferase [Schleiferiaceae bacterium]|nr:glycosyltransferase [Schleiferiaceae bacterium]